MKDLYLNLAKRWSEINSDLFKLQYIAPHERLYVSLTSDDDVSNMMLLHMIMKLNIVDILVTRKDEPSGHGRQDSDIYG